jgi:CARDB
MGYGYGQTGSSGYDLEPLFEVLDTEGFGDIGRQALRATETMAQSVRARNRQYRAVAVDLASLGSFHQDIAMQWGYRAGEQFGAVEDLIKELRNKPEWRTQVLPRLDEALSQASGAGLGSTLGSLVDEARRALLDIDDLSGKSAQEFLAIIRPYGSLPGSFDSFDNLLERLQTSMHMGRRDAQALAMDPVETETFESARTVCVETGFGLLAIAVVVSKTVPSRSDYQFEALVRLLPTVLSPCGAIAAEAPAEAPTKPTTQTDLPDLTLIEGPQGFCAESPEGHRIIDFIVRNSGTGAAGPSSTFVNFGRTRVVRPTPPLGPNEDAPFQIPIPPDCFDPDCEVTITVDADNHVTESDKDNNVHRFTCQGRPPAEAADRLR